MIATQNTKLNVVPGGILPVVHVSQYDVNRVLSFTLYDGNGAASIESGTTVTIEGTKPDGNGFQYAGTLSGNVVTVNTTVQMTAVEGTNECKLTLKKGTQTIGSALFLMEVEKAGLNENTPISETDLPLIIAEATEQMERAEAAATAAALSETHAATSETNAASSETNAATSEANAASSETNAAASATSASTDAASAGVSATNANRDALKSEGHAVGQQNGVDVSSDSPYFQNNAKYYAGIAKQYAKGGLVYKGSILFANIPTTGMTVGDMYDIKDDFVTDSRFQDGAGIPCDAGTNIIWNTNNKWDIDIQGGSGGHTILNESGTEMPQRSKLQFEGAIVSDDETNDATVVETVNPVDYEEDIYGVNLLKQPYYNGASHSDNGITFVSNNDGTVTASGTSTSKSAYRFLRTLLSNTPLKKGETYKFTIGVSGDFYINFWVPNPSWQSETYEIQSRTGELEFTVPTQMQESDTVGLAVTIDSGVTVNNLTFKPMLRKATIKDDTYRPFNQQSIQHQLTDQTNVLGAKNLLKNNLVSQVKNGVTFTKNADDSITLSGTATDASSNFWVRIYELELKKDVLYTLSLGIDESSKASKDACKLGLWNITGGSAGSIYAIPGAVQNEATFSIPDETVQYGIFVGCGSAFTGTKTIKPMLRLASDPDATYVPYAMTNRELTEKTQTHDSLINEIIDTLVPVGTIISVMANNAPTGYLKCDGTTYNISAYQRLANHFNTEFGSKNKFGGDGTTTFAVPDLRGEFLRGTGTNGHVNQGNGGTVGEHQDATVHQALAGTGSYGIAGKNGTDDIAPYNVDYPTKGSVSRYALNGTRNDGQPDLGKYTSRPTNTSVLYCIKY